MDLFWLGFYKDAAPDGAHGVTRPIPQVILHLFIAIGNGCIRESDLFFILAKKYKEEASFLDGLSGLSPKRLLAMLNLNYVECRIQNCPDYDLDELVLYTNYRKRRVYVGDMYLFLTEIERTLHQRIKSILMQKYGHSDAVWWKQGIPEAVRIKCVEARERDAEYVAHPYNYTTVMHIKEILNYKPNIFSPRLPALLDKDMKSFFRDMDRLNSIRNQVMHPVREEPPTENDFEFVRELHKRLDATLWR